tara:strand:- start:2507 stop:2887 length:381 start_codon:yes stop_codon:yes gene_type:complete
MPLALEHIQAGFPSPANDNIEKSIDLNEELIRNPLSTFFLRVSGWSMAQAGIQDNDLIIVDKSIDPRPGNIVIAILDGNFTLKRFISDKGNYYLKSENSNYPLIDLQNHENIQIWGVAIYSIHCLY